MPFSSYLRERLGRATIEPAGDFEAGADASLTLTYTAGGADPISRAGPHSLDSNWNRISVFLHDRRSLMERRHEKKAT